MVALISGRFLPNVARGLPVASSYKAVVPSGKFKARQRPSGENATPPGSAGAGRSSGPGGRVNTPISLPSGLMVELAVDIGPPLLAFKGPTFLPVTRSQSCQPPPTPPP